MGDTHVGLQARLMSQAMRKLSGTLSKFDTTAIFINQLREKIGVMFGSPETTPGGRALKFYSSVRLDVRKIENLKDGTEVVGSRTRVKVVKNKVAPPFRQCEFDIMYGKGISKEGSLIDVGVDLEIIKKAGAWFTYEGEQLGQGRENARAVPGRAHRRTRRDRTARSVRPSVSAPSATRATRPRSRSCQMSCSTSSLRAESEADNGRQGEGQGRSRRIGARVDLRDRSESRHAKNPKSCHERALGLLAVRPRSRRELERRLLAAGFEAEEVADVLARLERVGLIDDEAFARQLAEHDFGSSTCRPPGGRRAPCWRRVSRRELAAEVADAAPDDEQDRANALARSRAGRLSGVEPAEGVRTPHFAAGAPGLLARSRACRGARGARDRRTRTRPFASCLAARSGRSIVSTRGTLPKPDVQNESPCERAPCPRTQASDRTSAIGRERLGPSRSHAHAHPLTERRGTGGSFSQTSLDEVCGGDDGPSVDRHRRARARVRCGIPRTASRSPAADAQSIEARAQKLLLDAEHEAEATVERAMARGQRGDRGAAP